MARNMWLIVFTMNHYWRLLTKEDQDDYSGSEEKKDERIQETEEESSNTGHHKHPRHRHKTDRQDSLNQTSQLIPLPRNEKFKGQKVQNDYKMEAVQRQRPEPPPAGLANRQHEPGARAGPALRPSQLPALMPPASWSYPSTEKRRWTAPPFPPHPTCWRALGRPPCPQPAAALTHEHWRAAKRSLGKKKYNIF